jgi:hypothetical protein
VDIYKIIEKLSPEAQKELLKALKFYKDFHWGIEPDKILKVQYDSEIKPSVMLGYCKAIIYATKKKGDRKTTSYIHSFEKPLPVLACDSSGKQLFFIGGNYKITADGIVG